VVQCSPQPDELVAILGQGPIGLLFTMLVHRSGARILATDTFESRRRLALTCGAEAAWDPRSVDLPAEAARRSAGRGADLVIVAASAPHIVEEAIRCSRPGARILLFAQTSDQERVELSGADICKGERALLGCYSASVDLQRQSAELVFENQIPAEELISHCLPLAEIHSGIDKALHPGEQSLKIIIQPQRWSQ
jgi:L-iditol 2-dehydrogenase